MSDFDSQTVADSMEETKDRHRRYLRAVNNPIRRDIMRALKDGSMTTDGLSESTGLDLKTLDWHLKILEHGFCVLRKKTDDEVFYELTKEGLVVDFMDK